MAPRIVYSESEHSHSAHAHTHYEMLYILDGRISMRILGHDHDVQAGDLIFLNQFEEHSTRLLQVPYRRYYILISPQALCALNHDPELLSVFRLHGSNFPYVLSTGASKSRFDTYFSLLLEASEHPEGYQEERIDALLTLILTEAHALCPSMFFPLRENMLLPMKEILDRLDQNFSKPFSLSSLAQEYHVSSGCLALHFRKIVGMSPMQYVTRSRLTHAKHLLLNTDLSVQTIAAQCGFADLSNFSRRFREEFQCTPLQYRRTYRMH